MGRSKPANDQGPEVSAKEQERADLVAHHLHRLNLKKGELGQAQAVAKTAGAAVAAIRAEMTDLFHEAKADTRIDREDLEWALNCMAGGGKALVKHQRDRAFICTALGIPWQPDMLDLGDKAPVEVKDELAWNTDGYFAGRRAVEPKPPADCPERFVQVWMEGYHKGQEVNGQALARAGDLIASRNQPSPEPAVEMEPADEEAELDDAAARLRRSDFMNTEGPDADFEASEEELAAQTTRQVVQEQRDGDTSPAAA